ncbi:hypothetical protein SSX86_003273 [Deinandra increscens subsp. villosa]|uniref:Uncharacterized protein n=1 Tax=Deinandra increscens subsp. villosa TaxID=3103831 RepID=A0AAP0H6M3_9ASTR
MGSGLSHQPDTQLQSEVSPTSQNHENHQNTKTEGITTSTWLPHNCETILKDADTPIDTSSIDQLYAGVFLNKKRKKYWVDKASHGNCFMVYARDLLITWGEDNRYWHWPYIKETSEEVVDVAEMLNVCWLELHGKFEISMLTPGIKYEVVFMVMLKDPAYGWEVPINVRLILPDGNKQEHKENLIETPRAKWVEIPVGEFTAEPKKEGFVEFSLYEYEGGAWKKGLMVKGAAIRPKH